MHFRDRTTGAIDAAPVPLIHPVANITHVDRWMCHVGGAQVDSELTVSVVFFDRDGVFVGSLDQLRESIHMEAGLPVVVDEEHASLLGRLLWSRLHPDIALGAMGGGRHAYLGRSRIYFKSFFRWLGQLTRSKDLWSQLEERGRDMAVSSFAEWKMKLHFGEGDLLPTAEDISQAEQFLDSVAVEIAKHECRHRANPRWVGKGQDGRMPEEFYKRVRRNSDALIKKHELSPGIQRAATLLSYATGVHLCNEMADRILSALPKDTLDPISLQLFKLMWMVPETGVDDRGRFDIPIIASPMLASTLYYLLEIDDEGTARDKEGIVAELIEFVITGQRNRAVDIALGFSFYFPSWLEDERATQRKRSQDRKDLPRRHEAEERHLHQQSLPAKPRRAPGSDPEYG